MQLAPYAVSTESTDQVKSQLSLDQVLHRNRPIQQLSTRLDGRDSGTQTRDPRVHQFSIRAGWGAQVVGPCGIANKAILECADIDFDQITLSKRKFAA